MDRRGFLKRVGLGATGIAALTTEDQLRAQKIAERFNAPSSPNLLGFGVQFQLLSAAAGSPGGIISSPAVAWRF